MPEIYKVGGCVRDEILGIDSKDIDFTFVLDDLSQSVDSGFQQMTDFLITEGYKIFLSTPDCYTIRAKFPIDSPFAGLVADFVMARKEVGYTPGTRKPILELGSLHDDLIRRDFTCNAIATDYDGNLIDPFNGVSAIHDKLLVTPLEPTDTFMDDPLRMLRALRFSITKGFTIAPAVWDAIFIPGLLDKLETVVSSERIQTEVQKMMQKDTVATLRLLAKIDKIEPRLLEIIFSKGVWLLPTTKHIN